MAEPTCVMPSFSCTPQENENPMYGLGDSVSFGRYMTEDLSWERWSSFNDNNNRKRYVEEAEKYSRPGSVAQKKAYFEAHFKRVAALKAAALDQEDGAQESVEFEEGEVNNGKIGHEFSSFEQNEVSDSVNGRVEKQRDEKDNAIVVEKKENGDSLVDVEKHEVDVKHVEREVKEDPTYENVLVDQVDKNLTATKHENCNGIKEDSNRTTQMTFNPSPLQEINIKEQTSKTIVKKNPPLSSYLPLLDDISRTPVFTPSPIKSANSLYAGKENFASPLKPKPSTNDPDKGTPLHTSINQEFYKLLSPVIKKIGSSSQPSKHASPAKVSVNGMAEASPLNSNLAKRGDISNLDSVQPRQNNFSSEFKTVDKGRNKTSSPIVPSCFCWSSRDRSAKTKQEKAETRLDKFRLSFCFKAKPSTDTSNVYETHKSAKSKNITSSASRKPTKLNGSKTLQQTINGI